MEPETDVSERHTDQEGTARWKLYLQHKDFYVQGVKQYAVQARDRRSITADSKPASFAAKASDSGKVPKDRKKA
jgi:hypothetical protein